MGQRRWANGKGAICADEEQKCYDPVKTLNGKSS